MKLLYAAAAALLIGACGAGTAAADDISADVLTYDGAAKVATAEGNVVIHADEGATMTGASGEYRSRTIRIRDTAWWKETRLFPRLTAA